jgi:hypothetical protein
MMIMDERAEFVAKLLFEEEDSNVFAVLDGASVENLLQHLYSGDLEYECLYRGELAPDMAEVAPYLIQLKENSELTGWILENGWGKHWGVFAQSGADLRSLRRHFRTFLMIHDSTGKPLYFRYYDPRVLRVYLPTCNAGELNAIFGPVGKYLMEDEQGTAVLSFRNNSGVLAQRKHDLKPIEQEF